MKPRPRTAPASLALLAVLAAGGLAACGDDDAGTGSAAESTSTPSQDSPEDTSADDGSQEVSTDQVRLRLPEGWESLEAQEALADGEDGALAAIAERLGVPPAQLEATLQDVDLVAVADGGAQGGVLTNVNVLHQPGELPAEQQLAQQLEQFADTTGDVATVDSPVGDVLRADYQLDINGTPGQFEVLLAQVGADVVTITVTSADAADAAEVADLVVSSLEEA